MPREVIKDKCTPYLRRGEPACQTALTNADDYTIVATFGARYRGIVQYYLLAWDVYQLARLRWVMESSMLKTLAGKHHSTAAKMARKHKTSIVTPHGRRVCFEARIERSGRKPLVARFGGIPLHRNKQAVLNDRLTDPNRAMAYRKELVQRFLAGRCELRSDLEHAPTGVCWCLPAKRPSIFYGSTHDQLAAATATMPTTLGVRSG